MKYLTFSIILNLYWVCGLAQSKSCAEILADRDTYYSASASAESEEDAQTNARSLLVQQLSSIVSSRTDMTITAGNTSSEQSFYNLSQTISTLRLDGLMYQSCKKEKKDNSNMVTSTCYISKSDLNKSAKKVEETVSQYLELYQQKKAMGLDGLADAYTAYLQSYFTPLAIGHRFGQDSIPNVQSYLESLLRGHLTSKELVCTKVEEHPQYPDEQLRLHLRIKGEPAIGMVYIFDCSSLNAATEIQNNSGQFDILMQPSSKSEIFRGSLTMKPLLTKAELKDIASSVSVSRDVELLVDMTSIIKLDFTINDNGSYWEFVPKISHLSVSGFEWSSGGKRFSTEQLAKVGKEEIQNEVTLTLNRNSELSITKSIKPTTKAIVNTNKRGNKLVQESASTLNESVELVSSSSETEDVHRFASLSSFVEVQQKLKDLKNYGKAVYGKKSDFLKPDNCWILLVDPNTAKLLHVLGPNTKGRKDYKTGKIHEDFEESLKGMKAIWVELY